MHITTDDIIQILSKTNDGIDVDNINVTDSINEIGLDSLDIYTLLMGVEEKANITIPDEDIDKLNCIEEIVVYTNKKLQGL